MKIWVSEDCCSINLVGNWKYKFKCHQFLAAAGLVTVAFSLFVG